MIVRFVLSQIASVAVCQRTASPKRINGCTSIRVFAGRPALTGIRQSRSADRLCSGTLSLRVPLHWPRPRSEAETRVGPVQGQLNRARLLVTNAAAPPRSARYERTPPVTTSLPARRPIQLRTTAKADSPAARAPTMIQALAPSTHKPKSQPASVLKIVTKPT